MVFPGFWWLLSACLLSWCCNTWELEDHDRESESSLTPLVMYFQKGELSHTELMKFLKKTIPGIYIVPLEIGKNMMQDMENKVLNASSELCQILAEDPKLREGYIAVTFFKKLRILGTGRSFLRDAKYLP
ncbi:palmitoyl-protein thioesterase 1-like isoform X2 [Mesocricetus auratus]|uniref:Palmitoyl-protein thioesterase 1-like isoform X2 n=1 Tax=Mesocricetus auratus TaxID=10036 RepID=A0ABM2X2U1_MESAU|nr:palmitoyl-protein thioesterase 1-like isoform X2 [Mesocricetus auratus]